MYAQFFGSYLLNNDAVSPEQLTTAIARLSDTHIKLGTLAMHKGYMTASEVDEVCFLQTREDKRFGEIALERNYLFEDQLEDLLKSQNPDYLLLGQTLVDMGALSNTELESLMVGYQGENELEESPDKEANIEETSALIEHFFALRQTSFRAFPYVYEPCLQQSGSLYRRGLYSSLTRTLYRVQHHLLCDTGHFRSRYSRIRC